MIDYECIASLLTRARSSMEGPCGLPSTEDIYIYTKRQMCLLYNTIQVPPSPILIHSYVPALTDMQEANSSAICIDVIPQPLL